MAAGFGELGDAQELAARGACRHRCLAADEAAVARLGARARDAVFLRAGARREQLSSALAPREGDTACACKPPCRVRPFLACFPIGCANDAAHSDGRQGRWRRRPRRAARAACNRTTPPLLGLLRRRRGREAEGGGLLNRYTLVKAYRGFESPPSPPPPPELLANPMDFVWFTPTSTPTAAGYWRPRRRRFVSRLTRGYQEPEVVSGGLSSRNSHTSQFENTARGQHTQWARRKGCNENPYPAPARPVVLSRELPVFVRSHSHSFRRHRRRAPQPRRWCPEHSDHHLYTYRGPLR